MKLKSVYQFSDYREFLGHYYDWAKKTTPGFSFRKFSETCGMKSDNYLKLIIQGKRNLTIANIHQVAKALDLSPDEHRYFESLVLFNQAGSTYEKKYYGDRTSSMRKLKPGNLIRTKKFEMLSRWYYPAVLICLDGVAEEAGIKTVEEKTGLSAVEIKEAIRSLMNLGILVVHDGRYHLEGDQIRLQDKSASNIIQEKYLLEQLNRSLSAFAKSYRKSGKFFSHTFSISKDRYDVYSNKIKTFLEDITAESNKESVESIVQLNIQMFPLKIE